jgi:hypothetical protein
MIFSNISSSQAPGGHHAALRVDPLVLPGDALVAAPAELAMV